jgi:hypothetical protein
MHGLPSASLPQLYVSAMEEAPNSARMRSDSNALQQIRTRCLDYILVHCEMEYGETYIYSLMLLAGARFGSGE